MAERARPGARTRARKVLRPVLSGALVVGIFAYALPQFADFGEVWAAIVDLTWLETVTLIGAAGWNIATYMFVTMAVLPGIAYWQAFVVGQSSTAVATALPAGSALGVGVTYAMYSSWGRSGPEIALAAVLSGIWNNFVKLGLPVVALGLLLVAGDAGPAQFSAAAIGLGVLAVAVAIFAMMLRSERLAHRIGDGLARWVNAPIALLRRPPRAGWGDAAVRFRGESIGLLQHRWIRLTVATLVSHLSLYLVLLLALRHMGVAGEAVSWIEVLGVFAFVRLVTALPITPGGLGIVELGLVAALVVAGGPEPRVVAAVLVYRFLTLLVQVPIGAVSYLVWRGTEHRTVQGAHVP